jgi:hypothetical protein
MECDVLKILQDAGANPSGTDFGLLRNYIQAGLRHGFSAHEIVAFIAHGWPDCRPEDERARAEHPVKAAMYKAALFAVNQGQARSTAVLEASVGYDMAHVASRCDALYKHDD